MNSFLSRYIFIFVTVSFSPAFGQAISDTDLSKYEVVEEGVKILTLSEVGSLEDDYLSSLENEGCEATLPKISNFYDSANVVANILRQGNEPYYDARRDDQTRIARNSALLGELVTAEQEMNGLLAKRNSAWVAEAKCLIQLGDREAGITRLMRALDFISGTNEAELWAEARLLLWSEVGFSLPE